MDAVTYPQPEVAAFVADRVIPLRIASDAQPYARQFQVKWTPCLIALDAEGVEHYRSVGFLSAVELIPSLILRSGRIHFDAGDLEQGIKTLDEVIDKHPQSYAAPEAIFYRGVARYKHSDDPAFLKTAQQKLSVAYPDSEWALRAYPYSLL